MSDLDDRFIAFVCDNGPLTMEEITRRVGGSRAEADAILRWVGGRDRRARARYQEPIRHPDGRIEIRSMPTWSRERFLRTKGLPMVFEERRPSPGVPPSVPNPPHSGSGAPVARPAPNDSELYRPFRDLYRGWWAKFFEWLRPRLSRDGREPGLSPPLLIGPGSSYEAQGQRLMVFGQQTETWYNTRIHGCQDVIDTYMRVYRDEFRMGAVRAWTPFWQAVRRLEEALGIERYASLWNNLNKVDEVGSGGRAGRPSDVVEQTVSQLFPVIPEEVTLARPNVVIFFTGSGGPRPYDQLLAHVFPGAAFQQIDPPPVDGAAPIASVRHEVLPVRSFRTDHPGYFRRMHQWERTLGALSMLIRG